MSLSPGTRLGVYEILSPIGAGGMGEVYHARDTRLTREVAVKVLPEVWVHDADRLGRFQREAEILAALNHPNIAAIHGLEEGAGVKALLLEFVEGPTLAELVRQRPMPPQAALPIARQIAEALDAAHERGIVHRDLKPANIKVRSDGPCYISSAHATALAVCTRSESIARRAPALAIRSWFSTSTAAATSTGAGSTCCPLGPPTQSLAGSSFTT